MRRDLNRRADSGQNGSVSGVESGIVMEALRLNAAYLRSPGQEPKAIAEVVYPVRSVVPVAFHRAGGTGALLYRSPGSVRA